MYFKRVSVVLEAAQLVLKGMAFATRKKNSAFDIESTRNGSQISQNRKSDLGYYSDSDDSISSISSRSGTPTPEPPKIPLAPKLKATRPLKDDRPVSPSVLDLTVGKVSDD